MTLSDRDFRQSPMRYNDRGADLSVALVPALAVTLLAFLGLTFGDVVARKEMVAAATWAAPLTSVTVVGLAVLIAWRCGARLFGKSLPEGLGKLIVVLIAAIAGYGAAPFFVTHGLPAVLADRKPEQSGTEVVRVVRLDAFCPAGRRRALGAVVRNERLGGPDGVGLCRIPQGVAKGLRAGSALTLHGYLGAYGFHYDRITR